MCNIVLLLFLVLNFLVYALGFEAWNQCPSYYSSILGCSFHYNPNRDEDPYFGQIGSSNLLHLTLLALPPSIDRASIFLLTDDNDYSDHFHLDETVFNNSSMTGRYVEGMEVDVTAMIKLNSWYVVCMEIIANKNGHSNNCLQCNLIRTCKQLKCNQKFMQLHYFPMDWKAMLVFQFSEYPNQITKVEYRIRSMDKNNLVCPFGKNETIHLIDFQTNSVMEQEHKFGHPNIDYKLQVDIEFTIPANPYDLPKSFRQENYTSIDIKLCVLDIP